MMIHRMIRLGFFAMALFGLLSCKTYYIPVESFKEQFSGIDSTKLREVYTQDPYGYIEKYLTAPIDFIKCVDKNNNPYELKNSPSIEIRFTNNNNRRTIFYFDRVFLQDTLIIGDISRFLPLKKTISMNSVKLIEVQDGHKKFKYVDKKKYPYPKNKNR